MNRSRKWLPVGLFVLWTFFVLGSFFAVPEQKPFSAENVLAVGNSLLNLLAAGWLVLIALTMGDWILRRLRLDLSFIETLVLGTGLGLGMLGLLSLAVGLVGFFQPIVAYGITIALSVIFAPQIARLFRQWRRWRPQNFPPLWPAIYCLLIASFVLFIALLPPTDWDGLFYHLTGPKLYLQAGSIIGGIDIPHLNFPSLMEMLFAWAMLLRGDIAAKLLHACFGFLLAGLVYLTACRFLNKKAGWLAVLIFAGMPMVSILAGWAYNDLALAFYQFAALYAFISWKNSESSANHKSQIGESNQREQASGAGTKQFTIYNLQFTINNSPFSWLIFSGVFAGLAMGLKYTGFVTPLVIGGLILWYTYRDSPVTSRVSRLTRHALRSITNLAVFILPALLVALPWYLKNWTFTGNPVYPFLYHLFGGQYWDSFRADWYAAAGTGIGWQPIDFQSISSKLLPTGTDISLSSTQEHYLNLAITLLTLPWLLTLGVRDMNFWDGRAGPLLLVFLPLIVWAGFSRRSAHRPVASGPLLIYALAYFAFWTLGVVWSRSLWQSRLLLPALVVLAPVVGWLWAGLSNFDLPHFSLRRFVNIVIGLTLALTVMDVGLFTLKVNPLPYLVGLETRDAYLTRRLGPHHVTMQKINQVLPAEATIVFLWEPRSYYCQRDCRPDSILDTFPHLVQQYGSAAAIARAWQQAGVTHVLLHRSGLQFVLHESPEVVDKTVLAALETHFLRPVFEVAGAYQVYEVVEVP
ncbi:MAG: phospholipid carrier-dependent glycosyltransferase [Anaerolineae bacterium]|nr:phospholipid carrier-dependent glycosyltransferase [Anaerolineae bacterium]